MSDEFLASSFSSLSIFQTRERGTNSRKAKNKKAAKVISFQPGIETVELEWKSISEVLWCTLAY